MIGGISYESRCGQKPEADSAGTETDIQGQKGTGILITYPVLTVKCTAVFGCCPETALLYKFF
jgi:hypothetical protein